MKESLTARISDALVARSTWVIIAFVVVTLLLLVPLTTLGTDEQYAGEPGGEVFDLRDDVNERFAPAVHEVPLLVEARDGDILAQAPLWELYRNEESLRAADRVGELAPADLPSQPYLFSGFNVDAGAAFVGVYTIADAVQQVLASDPQLDTTLESASDDQVKIALHGLFSNPETSGLRETLSADERSERRTVGGQEIDYWTATGLIVMVLADNGKLGGGTFEAIPGANDLTIDKEEFNLNVQERLRGDQSSYRMWGVAIDANHEAAEEGQEAGIFIMLTVIGALIVVGLSLRSYWAVALTGAGLGALMIWLKGFSNLLGIKGGLVIDLIVPIAMISLGVDFAVHSLRRYTEERGMGSGARQALRVGLAGVLGALTLAMFSDAVAFLANASSGIDALLGFGAAAAIAVASSFIVLGIVVPLAMMRLDTFRETGPAESLSARFLTPLAAVGAAVAAAAGVIVLVAVDEGLGGAVIVLSAVVTVVLPAAVARYRSGGRPTQGPAASGVPGGTQSAWLVPTVAGLARLRFAVLPFAAAVTVAAALLASRLDATFDVKDFFDSSSDFVVAVDKVDELVGERGGEEGIIYVSGDLSDPGALASLRQFTDSLGSNPAVARTAEGEITQNRSVLDLLHRLTDSQYARAQLFAETGVEITDSDSDGLPDSREQVDAAYDYMAAAGVPLDETTLVYDPGQVRETILHDPTGGEEDVTVITVGIPGTREQEAVTAAREALEPDIARLESSPGITFGGLTGSPFTREATLDATTRTLQISLPIAAAAVFLLLLAAMRSLRYAVVTIIPIGLVAAWLYAFMYVSGFSLNFVTATIGAVSIGVGIDYSIHMTARFREELHRSPDRMEALCRATAGTGVALLASATSSIVGFAIMGFAPMPLFSSYGVLTAMMIFLALSAALFVLPSLLVTATPEEAAQGERGAESVWAD